MEDLWSTAKSPCLLPPCFVPNETPPNTHPLRTAHQGLDQREVSKGFACFAKLKWAPKSLYYQVFFAWGAGKEQQRLLILYLYFHILYIMDFFFCIFYFQNIALKYCLVIAEIFFWYIFPLNFVPKMCKTSLSHSVLPVPPCQSKPGFCKQFLLRLDSNFFMLWGSWFLSQLCHYNRKAATANRETNECACVARTLHVWILKF